MEVKNLDGAYQEAVINKLTDASWYTVVFDDGDEKTLRRSSLCLKGERHFAESEVSNHLMNERVLIFGIGREQSFSFSTQATYLLIRKID